jgi:uroporphyrinogen-III synthase
MREEPRLRVAAFRPADERLDDAVELLESLGADPVPDPMLAVEATDAHPRSDADYVVLTSKTGVELAADAGWSPGDATVCAIGESTADALRAAGYAVDVVPEEYSSSGLVEALADEVAGARVEVARSDHGSAVLLDGLEAAGAYVHETVLYRLVRPDGAGESAELAAEGDLDAAMFTSSLTVRNFLDAAAERGVRDAAVEGLQSATVGAIGEPTRETAEDEGIPVDVVPERADFDEMACEVVERAAPSHRE